MLKDLRVDTWVCLRRNRTEGLRSVRNVASDLSWNRNLQGWWKYSSIKRPQGLHYRFWAHQLQWARDLLHLLSWCHSQGMDGGSGQKIACLSCWNASSCKSDKHATSHPNFSFDWAWERKSRWMGSWSKQNRQPTCTCRFKFRHFTY